MNKRKIEYQLLNPSKDARNRTRWWWYGCAVDKEELKRELNMMLEAEIGGVELQILYSLEPDNEAIGIRNYEYLSPEFMEMIKFAVDEATACGMQFDLTLGSSWPFGGPFMPENLSGQSVLPFMIDVQGPCRFSKDLTTVIYGEVVGAVLGKMDGAQMLPESIVDITDKLSDKYLFNWPWGTRIDDIEIPEGLHKIALFVSSDKKQQVLKPLRGGEGLIVDHNRKESLRTFLEYAGDSIVESIGKGKIHNFFCDSIEVFGHNWTEILFDEFRMRRGYDLKPYIYALWGEIKDKTEQIRYDFHKTMSELTVENFFFELTKWSHEKGGLSRIQAHGTWGDILQAYGAADIPEGETFSEFDRYEVNTVHRKLAVSAGHIYHKNIISNESFTWLRFPRFVVTLEQIKAALDSIFLDGINQIVNHGYSYSKDDKGERMLAFYASTNINHTNTWWKYYKEISVYINRVCDFMQRGHAVINTAIYLPQHDIWAESPLSDIHMSMKLDERLDSDCINAIHKSGYWFDYVNDDVVENWQTYKYDTLILIECDRIPVKTMEKIQEFVTNGGSVIATGGMPEKACGLIDFEENSKRIQEIGKSLIEHRNVVVLKDKYDALVRELKKQKVPDVRINYYPENIGYVHRMTESEDIYFVSNVSSDDMKEKITFSKQNNQFCVFDPLTGKKKEVLEVVCCDEEIQVSVQLEPFQSLLFIFSDDLEPIQTEQTADEEVEICHLSSGWHLDIQQKRFGKEYKVLDSWEKELELRYYSGSGRYSKNFNVNEALWSDIDGAQKIQIVLEHVGEIAEIYVNGILADTLIKRPYKVDITGLLRLGKNKIEIVVTNLLINRMINPEYQEKEHPPIIPQWPYATRKLDQCRKERLFNWREREMIKEPFRSGIWGDVKIIKTKKE